VTGVEFLELATKLRALGAVRVRAGELEAVWPPSVPLPRASADGAQLQKLRDAAQQKEREREIEAQLPEAERLRREFERELAGGAA
jgi:hypothetical protein